MLGGMLDIHCSRCGAIAASFSAADGCLERSGWFGSGQWPMPRDRAEVWLRRIEAGPLVDLARGDPDMFGFVCRRCGVAYCGACWRIGPPELDDGFYDCTRGTCPELHEQTLDD